MPVTAVANGTVLSFASGNLVIVGISVTCGGEEINVSHLASAKEEIAVGLNSWTIVAQVLGYVTSPARGATGTLSCTPNGGSAQTFGGYTYVCTNVMYDGITVDGRMVTSVTFRPVAA